jgi:hypothetical protein
MEIQRPPNSQRNSEQKQQCQNYHNTRLQTILQNHFNASNTILAQKQVYRSVE